MKLLHSIRVPFAFLLLLGAGQASAFAQNPGGVTGANLWLKANAGTTNSGSNLTGWTDQAGVNTFTITGIPGYQANAINFNPIVSFNNANGNTTLPTHRLDGNTSISYVDGFAVYKSNTNQSTLIGSTVAGSAYGAAIFAADGSPTVYTGNGTFNTYQSFGNPQVSQYGIANLDVSLSTSPYATGRLNGVSQTMTAGSGGDFSNISFTPMIGGSNNNGSTNGWYPFNGEVAEMVLYPSSLSPIDKGKVESYLAIKYGISLGNNTNSALYYNSQGTVVWPGFSVYLYDIFGIGKDDGSGLNQPQSNSMNTGSGNGSGQSGKGNIVLSNPSSLDDNDYLIMGHDNGGLTEQTADLPVSMVNAKRLGREWKVIRTNDIGTVTLTFNTSGLTVAGTNASDFRLLIDTDGDGNFTNGTVIQVAPASYASSILVFNAVNLPQNAVFTILTQTPGPAVAGANLWLKADAGTAPASGTLTSWTDQTGNNTTSVSGNPQTGTATINFNNSISFDGFGDYIEVPGSPYLNTANFTINIVTRNIANSGYKAVVSSRSQNTNGGFAIYCVAGSSNNHFELWAGNSSSFSQQIVSPPTPRGDLNLVTAKYDGISLSFYINGQLIGSPVAYSYVPNSSLPLYIGGGTTGGTPPPTAFNYEGEIPELIFYGSALNETDRNKVESYLAEKYGITLNPAVASFVNSTGTVLWNNATYWNDVFGIGKDDASGLSQPASNSVNTGTGNGTGQNGKGNILIKTPSSLDDGDFLMIGHDNQPLTEYVGDLPAGLNRARLRREWKVKHTGNVGTVTMEFDFNGLPVAGGSSNLNNYILLIDPDGDGDFTNGTVTQVTPNAFGSPKLIFNNLTLPDGAVFTFVTSPGFPLPLNLLSFEAGTSNCSSNVQWKTANEVNVSRYEVQVSFDNSNWSTVYTAAANNSTDVNNYAYSYNHSSRSGNKLLRLKMVDNDGKTTYSKVISVQCGKDNLFTLYPNPASTQVTLTGTKSGEQLQVMGMDGRILLQQTATEGNTTIGMGAIPSGSYLVRVLRNGNWEEAGKIVKQ